MKVTCGSDHYAVLDKKGRVYSWGNWNHGGLGHFEEINYVRPLLVKGFNEKYILDVSCGDGFTMLIC